MFLCGFGFALIWLSFDRFDSLELFGDFFSFGRLLGSDGLQLFFVSFCLSLAEFCECPPRAYSLVSWLYLMGCRGVSAFFPESNSFIFSILPVESFRLA